MTQNSCVYNSLPSSSLHRFEAHLWPPRSSSVLSWTEKAGRSRCYSSRGRKLNFKVFPNSNLLLQNFHEMGKQTDCKTLIQVSSGGDGETWVIKKQFREILQHDINQVGTDIFQGMNYLLNFGSRSAKWAEIIAFKSFDLAFVVRPQKNLMSNWNVELRRFSSISCWDLLLFFFSWRGLNDDLKVLEEQVSRRTSCNSSLKCHKKLEPKRFFYPLFDSEIFRPLFGLYSSHFGKQLSFTAPFCGEIW